VKKGKLERKKKGEGKRNAYKKILSSLRRGVETKKEVSSFQGGVERIQKKERVKVIIGKKRGPIGGG